MLHIFKRDRIFLIITSFSSETGGLTFSHSLQDNLSLSPVLIFLKNKLLIKLFQTGEMWRICLQAYNQQHMNSIVRIKLHMLTSCLTHEDLKFGPWYKVSTWMTLWAIIKIPWNKVFSKVLIVCSPGMYSPHYWDTDLGELTAAGISLQQKVGMRYKGFYGITDAFHPLVSVWVGFFLTPKERKRKCIYSFLSFYSLKANEN